jgi:hypothetical protein
MPVHKSAFSLHHFREACASHPPGFPKVVGDAINAVPIC